MTMPNAGSTTTGGQEEASAATVRVSARELAELPPLRASEDMPDELRALLEPGEGLYVAADREGPISVAERKVGPAWSRLDVIASGSPVLRGLPGLEQGWEERAASADRRPTRMASTDAHRPAWVDVEYVPRLVPFRLPPMAGTRRGIACVEPLTTNRFIEPAHLARVQEALRFIYPWRTIGQVFAGYDRDFDNPIGSGTGVLVGRNLMLTASHVAPWGRGPGRWWMRFVPGHRAGDAPHGFSYVEQFYGTFSDVNDFEASGVDYVICKLYTPLGAALGWMGSMSFGNESEYYRRRFISVGYPGYFGDRPAVEFDVDIDDIDSDGAGLELETTYENSPFADGWSGGPLWTWENEEPYVVGVLSGDEKDELDPRRNVFAGGGLLVDRVRYGIANFS